MNINKTLERGMQYLEDFELDKADACFHRILKNLPEHHQCLNLSAIVALKRKDYKQAQRILKRAIKIAPKVAAYQHNLAVVLGIMGQFGRAEACFRRSIKLDPDYAEAYFNFAQVHKFTRQDPLLPALQKLLNDNRLDDEDLCFLHFAAGKIYDDLQEYEKAFHHYSLANKLKKETFSIGQFENHCAAIIECFNTLLLGNRIDKQVNRYRPIFVVGMPRSGTTLVEQILSSHPAITGAGELQDIPSIAATIPRHHSQQLEFPYYIASIDDSVLQGYASQYMKRVQAYAGSKNMVVDKMPDNFLRLGLLRIMFPNAIIIHCRRNKFDTCLSCFFQRFQNRQEFSYSLGDIAGYYKQYARLMEHWNDAGIAFLTVDYEHLIANPEEEIRRLISYCGLDWDDNCLAFHTSPAPVTTASRHQVRRPMYKTSVERWRRYEQYLAPLVEALQ